MIKAFVFDAYGTLYDVQSVAESNEAAFPGWGAYITQVWRMKQLEYSWLRSMMGQYEDFWAVTIDALRYTLHTIGQTADRQRLEDLASAYNRLQPYPDSDGALRALAPACRAIFSNGSPAMLDALVAHSGLGVHLERVVSVEEGRVFKPDRRSYELVEAQLGVARDEIVFVSSNGFDVCGAKQFGFRVVRIARLPAEKLAASLTAPHATIGPDLMYAALRTQAEFCGPEPDAQIASLAELPALVGAWS